MRPVKRREELGRTQTAHACIPRSIIPALCSSSLVTIGHMKSRVEIVGEMSGGVAWSDLVIPPIPVKAQRKHLSSHAILADPKAHVY